MTRATNVDEVMEGLVVPDETEEVEVTLTNGKTLKLQVRPLTWFDQSDAFAKSFGVKLDEKQKPVMEYNPSRFRLEILKRRLVNPPFPLTDAVLTRIDPRVGDQLAVLIPDPFEKMTVAQEAPKD